MALAIRLSPYTRDDAQHANRCADCMSDVRTLRRNDGVQKSTQRRFALHATNRLSSAALRRNACTEPNLYATRLPAQSSAHLHQSPRRRRCIPPIASVDVVTMATNGFSRMSDTDVRRTSVSSFDDAASSSSSNSTLLGRPQRLRILIVRHGETDYNVQGIIQGQMDTDLNSVGRGQAERVAAALALEHVDEVYSSPLRRARDTATAIVEAHPNQAHGRLSYWLDDRLKERGFGSLEGRSYDRSKPKRDSIDGIEQMNVFAARLASFIADVVPQPAPFSNTDDAIPLRYEQAVGGPPPRLNRGGCVRTIVVVAHGAAISAMMSAVLLDTGLACISAGLQRTRVWNCSITEVVVHNVDVLPLARASLPSSHTILNMDQLSTRPGKKAFVIERWADVRHLPDELDNAAASKGSADEMVGRQTG